MKIRTFLVAGILSTVIVIGSTVVGLVTASRNYHQALKHSRLENEISLGVFQLTALTFDYGQHEGGLIRAKRQWIVKHRSLEKLLKYPGNSDEIEIFGLNKLLSILNKAQALFVQAVSINEDLQKSGADLPIVKAQKRMLLAQVQTLIQNMSSEVSYLSANSSLVLQETTEKSERLIFLLLILLLIFMVVLVVLVGLQVVGPLRRLQEGISNFAAGDLDFRFNFSSRDEIGNVANSFNEMADKLHLTTVARDDLQKEISEQKQLEFELAYTQKMRAVGTLTGGVAHEFNNLLQVIMGNLDMVLSDFSKNGKSAKLICDAIDATEKGGELTQQLLSFSRKQTLYPKLVNVNDVVSGVVHLLDNALGDGIIIDRVSPPALWSASIDPNRFENALLSLTLNARTAMPNGGVMTIATTNFELEEAMPHEEGALPAGRYVRVSIADTGSGMTSEVMSQAFEPFYTTKEFGEATGLGLSMVYGFARQSGGLANIESKPGSGTTVRIYLPADSIHEIEKFETPPEDKIEVVGPTSGTILLVEDNHDVRETVTTFLEKVGYDVIGAEDGPSALKLLRQRNTIDLVLSDVVMPKGLSGIDLAEEIYRNHQNVKVLLMSGYPISEIDKNGTIEDRFIVLKKPCSNYEISVAVKIAIGKSPRHVS